MKTTIGAIYFAQVHNSSGVYGIFEGSYSQDESPFFRCSTTFIGHALEAT